MAGAKRQKERLIALCVLGLFALNYPFLALFSKVSFLFKIPVLFLYIFLVWGLFIGCVAFAIERPPRLPPVGKAAGSEKSR